MKTITLTDKQFDTLFEYVDNKVTTIVDTMVEYQDSEILDDLFYPEFDKLASDDLKETVAAAEEALADEPEINGVRSLNFRSNSFGKI